LEVFFFGFLLEIRLGRYFYFYYNFFNFFKLKVRHPRQFATELVERLLEIWQSSSTTKQTRNLEEQQRWRSQLDQVTKALVLLAAHHPTTVDMVCGFF